ncbi:MAG: hypothetical protein IJ356_10515 [Erysipelotrichaceae bacterium]|nr:hypothetical protein [Erysipelotrichaceae bacterium]
MKIRKIRCEDEIQTIIDEAINDKDGHLEATETISLHIIETFYIILLEESKLSPITIQECSFNVSVDMNCIYFSFEINAEGKTQDILSVIHNSKKNFHELFKIMHKIPWHFNAFHGCVNIKNDYHNESIELYICCLIDPNDHFSSSNSLNELETSNRTKVILVDFNDENDSFLQMKVKPIKCTDIEKTRIH